MLPPTRRARGHLTRHSFPAPPVRAQGELTFPGSDASPCLPRVRRLLGCPGSSAIVTLRSRPPPQVFLPCFWPLFLGDRPESLRSAS